MTGKRDVDDVTGTETTGHAWDGIKELNTPLPRWWLIIFYVTIAWSVVYWVLMPSWPLIDSYTTGVLGHSQRSDVAEAVAGLKQDRAQRATRLQDASLEEIEADPALLEFAMAAGESAFGDNCATCHGAGGQGFIGYPSLVDDDWLWGGTLGDIAHTLNVGIRAAHPETRMSAMPSYGRDGLLTRDQINDLVEYVVALSGREADAAAVARAEPVYQEQCAMCHGPAGEGDRLQGSPRLNDMAWLYGGEREQIFGQIWNARAGVMPAWSGRLDPMTIKALSVYVHALGGGERAAPGQQALDAR